ncbi:NADPH-dependent FMN reductase [Bordetella petrii]|uniref:FMN reductase n=1 Tax=Bordetella petrii (strain ATCC BAA-461 / DSM 12804 / CCUG 43448 / CIP 107267 / Se-1111R) TaxID=340100 RepID=A9IMS0_BORPD|nr:NADPH-dependent FMN reductase [Bordetella petrii]CAP42743.1 FMN reductase [Bordetella petrii]
MPILMLAGSPALHSRSSALLRYAGRRLAARGLPGSELGLRDLPAEDLIEGRYSGAAASHLRRRVAQAQALLIASPVYKASFAGGLKAILDLLDEKALADKIVLPIATGGSAAHLLALEYSLKPVLSALGARHILAGVYATDRQVTVRHDEAAIDAEVRARLDAAVDRLAAHVTTAPPARGYDLAYLALNARFSI